LVTTAVSRALKRLTRSLLVGAALAVVVSGVVVGTAGTTATAQTAMGGAGTDSARLAGSDTYETRVQRHINRKRAKHGLRPLRFERCTDGLAETWSARLAATGGLVHQDAGRMLSTCSARYAAEALGRGGFSPKSLVRAWMRSPYHRTVLLSPKARRIGVGSTWAGGQWVTAATFTRF
jgi:uncharacterized protein YkwD